MGNKIYLGGIELTRDSSLELSLSMAINDLNNRLSSLEYEINNLKNQ